MVFVYIVRCNFTAPAKEQAWNAWYSGPKIEQMLAKPHFRTCQRFRLAAGSGAIIWRCGRCGRRSIPDRGVHLRLGFFEWASHVTDWSRDLFDGGAPRKRTSRWRPEARCARYRSTA